MSTIIITTANGVFDIIAQASFGEILVALLLVALIALGAARWLYDATVERWQW